MRRDADRMPRVEPTGAAVGQLRDTDAVLAAGSVDALCEQLVAGADRDGDVLVLCGTTLIVWMTIPEYREVPGLWTLPHTAPGKFQIGGPSNAGGLFLGWVNPLVAGMIRQLIRTRAGVVAVRPRRARAVLRPGPSGCARRPGPHPRRRLGAAGRIRGVGLRRTSAHRAAAAHPPPRIVATGGGTRVQPWMQAIADATGLPVDVSAVPEGAAWERRSSAGWRPASNRRSPTPPGGRRRSASSNPILRGRPCRGPLRPVPRAGRARSTMTGGIFDDASMVSTILRVRDVAASVAWYREKLGLEPIHVGADGPEHPIAVYTIAGSVVSLWQLPAGQARVRKTTIATATWSWS